MLFLLLLGLGTLWCIRWLQIQHRRLQLIIVWRRGRRMPRRCGLWDFSAGVVYSIQRNIHHSTFIPSICSIWKLFKLFSFASLSADSVSTCSAPRLWSMRRSLYERDEHFDFLGVRQNLKSSMLMAVSKFGLCQYFVVYWCLARLWAPMLFSIQIK